MFLWLSYLVVLVKPLLNHGNFFAPCDMWNRVQDFAIVAIGIKIVFAKL